MAVKEDFLVFLALLVMAAGYPNDSWARTAQENLTCIENSFRTIVLGDDTFNLEVCTKSKWYLAVVLILIL